MIVKAIIMFIITEQWLWERSSNNQIRSVSMVMLVELLEARGRRLEFMNYHSYNIHIALAHQTHSIPLLIFYIYIYIYIYIYVLLI